MKRLLLAIVPFAFAAVAVAQAAPATPAPAATPTALPAANATPAPPKDVDIHANMTGVWEIAMQAPDGVVYSHFNLKQDGNTVTGQYLDENGKKFPLSGTIDGKTVRVVVSLPGSALVFNGTEEAFTDMVGTLTGAKDVIGFTAAYRPKFKWIDNISPGGLGGLNGGNPVP